MGLKSAALIGTDRYQVTAYTFTIRARERSQLTGQVICPDARYISALWTKSAYPDRRFANPAQWKDLIRQLDDRLPAAPLDDKSAVVQVLVGDRAPWVAQYFSQEPIGDDVPPSRVIVQLDQRVRMVQVE